jgi:toxin FitB
MKGWLLDTNILSAFGPEKRPLPQDAIDWFRARTEALYLSTISAAEIEAGIAKLRRTGSVRRADNLRHWFDSILDDYADRLLSFDLVAARIAGPLGDAAQAAGRHPGFYDIAIAAIANARELVVLTSNLRHFQPLGVEALNPFDATTALD